MKRVDMNIMATNNRTEREHIMRCVGYLVGLDNEDNVVVCGHCVTPDDETYPIFHDNIYPYKQTCMDCGSVLVEPANPNWPELFESNV